MKTLAWTIAVIAGTVVTVGCGANPDTIRPPSTSATQSFDSANVVQATATTQTAKSLLAEIENAYGDSSNEQLAAFFRRWHESERPINLKDVNDPLERDLYAIYLNLFRPFELDELAGVFLQDSKETYDNTYVDANYVIVPTSLTFRIGTEGVERTLENFRPPVNAGTAKVLFLTPAYRQAVEAFLDSRLPSDLITDPEKRDDDSAEVIKRFEFIREQVRIEPGHWEGWDLLTYPSDVCVEFSNMKEAYVSFSLFSLSGMATMKCESGEWRMVDSAIVGME